MNRPFQRRRSVWDFLAVPAWIVVGFVFLALLVDWFDNHAGPRQSWGPVRSWLSQYVGDTQAAIGVLSAIAGSLFTVTSLTFSILLLAVQQGATVLNSQVVDHYLRRRSNRIWFGFFVGVSLFVLIPLVQTTHTASPILGVMVSTFFGALALTALVVLIYATVDQTRPMTVIQAIAETALQSRARQLEVLRATCASGSERSGLPVLCPSDGYFAGLDIKAIQQVLASAPDIRIALEVPLGTFVPNGAVIARITGTCDDPLLGDRALACIVFRDQREIENDPAYSLDHIATIGWTAISTARSDPAVGTIVIHALQKLLHAWALPAERGSASCRVSLADPLVDQLLDSLESLVVAATESHQHQSLALILNTLSTSIPLLPTESRTGIFRITGPVVAALADHLPTRPLCAAVARLTATFAELGAEKEARILRTELAHLFVTGEGEVTLS